ncbi:MAG: tetratricopeptide repeat protein [Planctomycetes bacterium]|nr:tetratricopeptide repeat protein [Planctomycetota bacterium]
MRGMTVVGLMWAALSAPGLAAEAPAKGGKQDMMAPIHARINALQAKCDQDPKAWEPRYDLAKLYVGFAMAERALKLLDEAIAIKPEHVPFYQLAGEARLQLKETDKAIEWWQKALKIDPKNERAKASIAFVEKQREQEAQEAALDEKLKKSPGDLDALLERAKLRSTRTKWAEALADAGSVLAKKPDHVEALGIAAVACYRLEKYDEAIAHWTHAAKLDPGKQSYAIWLEYARKAKAARDSLVEIEAKVKAAPADGKLRLRAGEMCASLGKLADAMKHLSEAVRLLPNDAAARKAYGLLLFRMGQMDEALAELEKCIKLDPKNPEYQRALDDVRRLHRMHREMKKGD